MSIREVGGAVANEAPVGSLHEVARRMQEAVLEVIRPPNEVAPSPEEPVVPYSLFRGTRGYIEKVVHQINRTYSATCYDACAVMSRRLAEVLIIEAFEHHGIASKIKNHDGDYVYLGDLIDRTLAEQGWHLGRGTKSGLRRLKTIGDQSAHSRRYNAKRSDVDRVVVDLRTAAEELLYLAGLRS